MSHDEFTKLYKFMSGEFASIRNEFNDLAGKVNSYANLVDSYAKRSEIYHEEMLVLNHRVDRSEKWIVTVADKVGVKLITH